MYPMHVGRWSSLEMVERYTRSLNFDDCLSHYKAVMGEKDQQAQNPKRITKQRLKYCSDHQNVDSVGYVGYVGYVGF